MKNKCMVILFAVFFLSLSLWNVFGEKETFSESERRVLAKFPEVSFENIINGDFSDEFEDYAVDHFQMRDTWRGIKAYAKTSVLGQKDNNGLFQAEGHLSKIEYPMDTRMLDHAIEVFKSVENRYLSEVEDSGNHIYLSVIPDKNRYLASQNGYLSMDYDVLSKYMKDAMPYASYIEISDLLEVDDYYFTDTHWRQEKIIDVAERIGDSMGVDVEQEYEQIPLDALFYGVYVGQSALKCKPDTIYYLQNDMTRQFVVEGADAVYDMKKAEGRDPYEMFLSGNQPVMKIKNELCTAERRLVVFRDSFGSAIAPLLATGYSEVVLVDLRYISSNMIGQFVDFKNADVLFLYSTMLLNNSMALK